jgi:hypothetical protein
MSDRQVPPRMWVRIKGTNTAIPIDTAPQWSYEDNVSVAMKMAKKHLEEKGVVAVASYSPPGDDLTVGEIDMPQRHKA